MAYQSHIEKAVFDTKSPLFDLSSDRSRQKTVQYCENGHDPETPGMVILKNG